MLFFEIVSILEQDIGENIVPLFSAIYISVQNKLFPLSENYFLVMEEGLFQMRKVTGSQNEEEPK